MSARRFLWRWTARLVRREWRQHLVIFWLIVTGVALSVGGILAAYNLVEPPQSEFGNGRFGATSSDPDALERNLTDQGLGFGAIESATLQVTGSTQRVDTRVTDETNAITAPLFTLLDGRWPAADDEVAVTDLAVGDSVAIGSRFELERNPVTVVGIVENPTRLSDEFVLTHRLAPFVTEGVEASKQFLVDADPGQIDLSGVSDFGVTSTDGPPARTVLTLVVNVVSALGMMEVALLVGAGFAVIARRRTRQFGLLAATGATPRHIRMAATSAGTLVGICGTAFGLVIGLAIARWLVPGMETTVDHRIDFAVPWLAIAPSALLAIGVATLGARWPTRALSELPVAHLLASLRPRPAPVGRSTIAGVVLAVAGALALATGFARLNTFLALLGVVVAPLGLLLMSPLFVKLIGSNSSRLPLAARMASRVIGRHNRRSAAVVSALALALAIPIGMAVVSTSIDERSEALGPNLADNWLIAWQPGADDAASRLPVGLDADVLAATGERIAAAAPDLRLIPLETAIRRDGPLERWDFATIGSQQSVAPVLAGRQGAIDCLACDSYSFGETDEFGNEIAYIVEDTWLASAELLDAVGIDAGWLADSPAVARTDEYKIIDVNGVLAAEQPISVGAEWPNNSGIPPLLVSPEVIDNDLFDIVGIGWFISSDKAIDADLRDTIRGVVGPDLVLEFHAEPQPQSSLRTTGLAVGLLVGLGIALSAVGLFTAELGDDMQILSTIGASPRTGRRLSASVAGILAAAGALIAVFIGYLPLLPLLTAKEIDFPFVVPWSTLAGFLVLFPVLAAGAGWIAGRKQAVARTTPTV